MHPDTSDRTRRHRTPRPTRTPRPARTARTPPLHVGESHDRRTPRPCRLSFAVCVLPGCSDFPLRRKDAQTINSLSLSATI